MDNQFSRTELVLGERSTTKLAAAHVAVFGVGGVGSYAVEALARAGIGFLDLVDSDKFELTNLNRQLYALHSTIGKYKVDVAAQRINDINPACRVNTHKIFYLSETASQFDFSQYDYIVDAIDTVSGKISLVEAAAQSGTPIISAMGAGNKVDPSSFIVADISQTSVCPLAKVMRKELGRRNIKHLKVVYSKEPPLKSALGEIPGSTPFTPPVVGMIMAAEVIKDIIGFNKEQDYGKK